MTKDQITAWAQECHLIGMRPHLDGIYQESLERFAALAYAAGAAAEREACAKVCENMTLEWKDQPNIAQAELATLMECALAIRARGLT